MSAPAVPPPDEPLVEVDRAELARLLFDPDVTVLDVLPRADFEAGHIPGSASLPLAEIEARAPRELPDRARTLVVYCASSTCQADRKAVRLLRGLGYRDVRAYTPGLAGWSEAGGPVERGPGPVAASVAPSPAPPGVHVAPIRLRPPGDSAGPGAPVPERPVLVAPGGGARPRDVVDRVVGLPARRLLGLWLGIIVAFGLVYWLPTLWGAVTLTALGAPVGPTPAGLWTALYFSFVTGLSVGYGDVVPVGLMRVPAVIEGAADLLLFGFVVSRFMSRRQDQLLEQLHHTAFEERLGRVRTNLHLVLSEFEAVARDARRPDPGAAAGAVARAESAALIFAGELRTIHEILYRPTEPLEEGALEGILASLAANLEALRGLLGALPEAGAGSPVLGAHLRRAAALADEICGDCVPHAYDAALRVWMDRVRGLARDLSGGSLADVSDRA